jgi:hypothetical protein
MDFPACTEESRQKTISLRDCGSRNNDAKFILSNPKRLLVKVIQIDDCVITGSNKRCDRLIILPSNKLIYIEFKGNKVDDAVEQIEATINYISQICSSSRNFECTCLVVCRTCSKTPKTKILNYKQKFKKLYNADLRIERGEVHRSVED